MLRLTATDADDLNVISAQMQDAVLKFADLKYDKKKHRFALVGNRFAWEDAAQKQRRRAGLHFDYVKSVQQSGFHNVHPETVLCLLAMTYTPIDNLAGHVTLAFSAGHQLRLDVECLDAVMADMGPAWATDHTPKHGA